MSSFLDNQLHHTAHRCPACLAVFKDTQVFPTPEVEKARYDTHHNTLDNTGYVDFLAHFLDRAVRPFVSQGRSLDYGCGPGPVCVHLMRERGFEATGYDPLYAPDTPLIAHHYDVITCTEVLEHVFDPHAIFQQFQTLCRPGGFVAIMTLFVPERNEDYLTWWYRRDETHVGFYHPLSLSTLAAHHGFEVMRLEEPNLITLRRLTDESIR